MKVATTERSGVVVVTLDGAILGGPEATSLNQEFHHLIDQGTRKVVVDLAGVTLMNSSGLGMLIAGYTTLRNVGGDLRLACVNENIRNLISITKLNTIFQTCATVDDAVDSF